MMRVPPLSRLFSFNDTATTEIYTLSLHDALPISGIVDQDIRIRARLQRGLAAIRRGDVARDFRHRDTGTGFETCALPIRSEEHTSELQSPDHLVCRLLLEKKKTPPSHRYPSPPHQ